MIPMFLFLDTGRLCGQNVLGIAFLNASGLRVPLIY